MAVLMQFKDLALGQEFHYGGYRWHKRTARTACTYAVNSAYDSPIKYFSLEELVATAKDRS